MTTDEAAFQASIQALAKKLDQASADEELAHRYELGNLLAGYTPRCGKQNMTKLAGSCGWQSPNPLYRAKKVVQLIDRRTFKRIVAARANDGRPLFVWDDTLRPVDLHGFNLSQDRGINDGLWLSGKRLGVLIDGRHSARTVRVHFCPLRCRGSHPPSIQPRISR